MVGYDLGLDNSRADDRRGKRSKNSTAQIKRMVGRLLCQNFCDSVRLARFRLEDVESCWMSGTWQDWFRPRLVRLLTKREVPSSRWPFLKRYLAEKAPPLDSMRAAVSSGNFKRAFKLFGEVTQAQDRWNAFSQGLFLGAIETPHRLGRFLHEMRQDLQSFERCLKKLLKLRERGFHHVPLFAEQVLGYWTSAAETAIEMALSHLPHQHRLSMKLFQTAASCVSEALTEQPNDQLQFWAEALPLQIEILHSGVFSKRTILGGPASVDEVCVLLFRQGRMDLALTAMLQFHGRQQEIGKRLADVLFNEGESILSQFLLTLSVKASHTTFRILAHAILTRLRLFDGGTEMVLRVVGELNKLRHFPTLVIGFFCDAGAFSEALQVAKDLKTKDTKDLIAIVGQLAFRRGVLNVAEAAQRLLERG